MQTTLKTADAKPAYEAPSFTDTKGRVWSLDFTLGTFRVLSKEVGLDLSKVLEDGQALVGFLFAPAGVRGNALWLVVRKQAEAVGVTEDEFFDSLDAEAMRAGCEAVLLAVADYYPRKVYGNAVRENLPKVLETLDAAIASKTPATLERLAETPAA